MSNSDSKLSYFDQPCKRCGSKKRISKTWNEEYKTTFGSSKVEISQIVCTNDNCQEQFDLNREKEILQEVSRKQKKEEQDKLRKEAIAKVIDQRKANKKIA